MKRSLILACTLILFAFVAEPASAQVQTATAHGAGTIPGVSFDTVLASFNAGGQGVSFHFDFRGSGMGPGIPVSGSFTVIDRETGVSLDFSGAGAGGWNGTRRDLRHCACFCLHGRRRSELLLRLSWRWHVDERAGRGHLHRD